MLFSFFVCVLDVPAIFQRGFLKLATKHEVKYVINGVYLKK
jgi:hypothetical protein